MSSTHSFKLVDGTYEPKDAVHVLLKLVQSKINFHNHEAFSTLIRYNGDVSSSEKRVEELKLMKQSVQELMQFAEDQNMVIRINGTIEVALEPVADATPA